MPKRALSSAEERAIRGLGARLLIGATNPISVGGLTNIPSPAITAEEIDVTTLESDGGFREHIQGFLDAGEMALEGFTKVTSTGEFNQGQQRMYDLLYGGEVEDFVIVYPPGVKAVWVLRGIVTAFSEPFTVEGAVAFNATIRISGKPQRLSGADADPFIPASFADVLEKTTEGK